MRGATVGIGCGLGNIQFQSTRPMRGATKPVSAPPAPPVVSIHAPHAGRDNWSTHQFTRKGVSIHAPHAGRDQCVRPQSSPRWSFNPRAPCGARPILGRSKTHTSRFQSTRPMRGATPVNFAAQILTVFQSTRPMRGATWRCPDCGFSFDVSIHAPHAGRDAHDARVLRGHDVSIHAPHAGRDLWTPAMSAATTRFNPRAPCGARPS